jgi:hypothetical protein
VSAKILCVGFHKTGTTSLQAALSTLGFSVCSGRTEAAAQMAEGEYDSLWRLTERYDAFRDNPWPLLYREFDERWPGSRFILTWREESLWLQSVLRHFGATSTPMRRLIYGAGSPTGHEAAYLRRYRDHNRAVAHYFRQGKALVSLNWEQGDGWRQLCQFLDRPIPPMPFPHLNKAAQASRDASDYSSQLAPVSISSRRPRR